MVLDVLQHLAMFKYFEGIENRTPSQPFEDSFSLSPAYDAGLSNGFNIRHGEEWHFTIENFGSRPLYMVVFNLDPLWKASNLISNVREGDFMVILPKEGNNGKKEIRLKMEVPEALQKRGKSECEDVVKVFVTNKPTFFPSVVLPEMPLGAESFYDTTGLDGRVRSSSDQLSRLLSQLTTNFRGGQGSKGNTKTGDEEWACRNFVIRTYI